MNEVMALNGLSDYNPNELKKQGNFLAAYGVSHVINHALKMTRQLALTHEFAPVVTDRVRVILRKGRFYDPNHPDVLDVTVLSDGRTVACRVVKETFTVKYDNVKAVELSLPTQAIDGVRVSSAQGLTSYRVEVWEDDRWKTVSELDTYSRSEVNNPIAYPDGVYDVTLTDWKEWDFLPGNFAGVITYRSAVTLPTAPSEDTLLEIAPFCGSVSVTVNGVPVGVKMFAPFTFPVGHALRDGTNDIELRVSNTISSNHWGTRGGVTGVRLLMK